MGRKLLTAIRKQTSQKRKKTGPKKKSLGNIFIPDFFGGETSHRNKNKQTSKKKKKTGTTKKLEELGVVMVAILTEAFKLLHLQVPNIANIK